MFFRPAAVLATQLGWLGCRLLLQAARSSRIWRRSERKQQGVNAFGRRGSSDEPCSNMLPLAAQQHRNVVKIETVGLHVGPHAFPQAIGNLSFVEMFKQRLIAPRKGLITN